MSRCARVTENLIDELQQHYRAGRDLHRLFPHLSVTEAAVIASGSMEADRLLQTHQESLLRPFRPLTD